MAGYFNHSPSVHPCQEPVSEFCLWRAGVKNRAPLFILVALLLELGCGWMSERVSHDDPRLTPMFDAMQRVDRGAMGFTSIAPEAKILVEWGPRDSYDVMLHVYGKTSRTVAFKRTGNGYEWIGEQEIFEGPREYESSDGTANEALTIDYQRVPISGQPINIITINYWGGDPELAWRRLSLSEVQPLLEKWGYD